MRLIVRSISAELRHIEEMMQERGVFVDHATGMMAILRLLRSNPNEAPLRFGSRFALAVRKALAGQFDTPRPPRDESIVIPHAFGGSEPQPPPWRMSTTGQQPVHWPA